MPGHAAQNSRILAREAERRRATCANRIGRLLQRRGIPDDAQVDELADGEPLEVLKRLAVERGPTYESAADVVLDTDGLTVAEVGSLVLEAVSTAGGASR